MHSRVELERESVAAVACATVVDPRRLEKANYDGIRGVLSPRTLWHRMKRVAMSVGYC